MENHNFEKLFNKKIMHTGSVQIATVFTTEEKLEELISTITSKEEFKAPITSEEEDKEDSKVIKVKFNIVFVTAEAEPYSKTGGLGDVCGSLPIALAARGHRVMVVLPRYLNGQSDKVYGDAVDLGKRAKVSCCGAEHEVAFFHEYRENVDWVRIVKFY
jgi:Starch synthase catalytic domain